MPRQPKNDGLNLEALFGSLLDAEAPCDDDQWEKTWDAREKSLVKILGKTDGKVLHAMVPFFMGGSADVLTFPRFPGGMAWVTAELTGGDSGQKINRLGNYELMICCRHANQSAADFIARLATRTVSRKFEPGDLLDLRREADAPFDAVVFAEGVPQPRFHFADRQWGLLLCVGIDAADLKFARAHGTARLLARLKREGRFPFSTFRSAQSRPCAILQELPAKLKPADWKKASPAFIKVLDQSLQELRAKAASLHAEWGFGNHQQWNLDTETGKLVFTMPDGVRVNCRAQYIATYRDADKSWEWVWNNPGFSKAQAVLSNRIKEFGATHRVRELATGMVRKLSPKQRWAIAALAAHLSGAAAAWCGNSSGMDIYLVFDKPRVIKL